MVVLRILLLSSLCGFLLSVDRANFKTCSQSGFCKRQRATEPGQCPYRVQLDTVQIQDDRITAKVLNKQSGVQFMMELSTLENNMVRFRMAEAEPAVPRYEPLLGDVLVQEPKTQSMEATKGSDSVTLTFGDYKVILQSEPLRIDVLDDNTPVISVNSRGLLKFEHTREKQNPPPVVDDGVGDNEEGQEDGDNEEVKAEEEEEPKEEEPDAWEETFKTHKDTKPHGPQSVGLDFTFPGFEHVYGIPEHADTLALKSTKHTEPYRLYNLDVFEYELHNPMALYGSIPVMYAHNEKRTVGMFWLNAAETWVDISSNVADKGTFSKIVDLVKGDTELPQTETHWFSESGVIDVFVMLGPTARDVMKQYSVLTGTTPLPPLFALAYHQSRWNYNDEQDVANVNSGFDEVDIPMDVIWLDIEHTDGKRYFTWDKSKFPNSEEMLNNITAMGRRMVTIVDPHIKRDDNYHIHKQVRENNFYIKNKDGGDYDGWCWPGSAGWPDFLDPAVREFWAKKFLLDDYEGTTLDLYTWNDMNEPSVFNGPEITMHKDAKHYGGYEHRDVHNVYGMYVHRATYEGHLLRSKERRPFVLSRAFYAGSQRWGAVWTGDNTGEWGHLKISLPMILTLNLAGITLSGADVGGFFKNPDHELLTRWYQAGAYQPFFRAHAHLDTRRREPWLLSEDNKNVIREAIRARYALLPLWYTLFYRGEQGDLPPMRPLWMEFPGEKNTFSVENEYMIGTSLLVHPVTDAGASGVNVFFPGQDEIWYDVDTYKIHKGGKHDYIPVNLHKIPVFQRGGTIVPRKERVRRASSLTYNDPYTLTVALSHKGTAKGELYIDDYDNFNYMNGNYALREFTFEDRKLANKNENAGFGSFKTPSWLERVTVVGVGRKPEKVTIQGDGIPARDLDVSYHGDTQTLVIRKPDVNINTDWTITLH